MPPDHVHPLTRADWRQWLAEHHATAAGVWMVWYRVHTGKPAVSYNEAVEEALCFGWVDSKPDKVDADRSRLYFAPRKPGSAWAKTNKDRVATLIAAGLMHPAGLAKVEAAQKDGNWTKLDGVERLEVPPDLLAALTAHPPAETNFAAFPRSARRGILEWILQAKTPATRAKRVLETATLAARNERANQWPRPPKVG
jgi:uncharacterized protein YdeI (YjbR/CyaY-like superfamily)